jgi:flagellar motor switch protein FliG
MNDETAPIALTGPQKAVLMILSMEESTAVPVLSELTPEEVRELRDAAEALRSVPVRQLGEVYAEFITRAQSALAVPRGGVRYLEQIASRALGSAESDVIFQEKPRSSRGSRPCSDCCRSGTRTSAAGGSGSLTDQCRLRGRNTNAHSRSKATNDSESPRDND